MHESEKWKWSCSVVSNSFRPHGLQHARLPCPSPYCFLYLSSWTGENHKIHENRRCSLERSHSCCGEGNGNPLQYSCLENPVDGGAWWAAVHGVVQGQTRLKRLSVHACIGEGNGNPLQCSCLENPRDRRAWWAAVYGVTQSQTRLKWLSSSSSRAVVSYNNILILILFFLNGFNLKFPFAVFKRYTPFTVIAEY